MPKTHATYTHPLNILVTQEMKLTLIAIGYHRGKRGRFGGVTKDILQAGINAYLAGLSPLQRRAFDEILENVRIKTAYQGPGQDPGRQSD